MCERHLVLGDFQCEGINFVDEENSRKNGVLLRVMLLVGVPSGEPRFGRYPHFIVLVVLVFDHVGHEWQKALGEKKAVGLQSFPAVVRRRRRRRVCLVDLGNVSSIPDVRRRDDFDEILKEARGTRGFGHDFSGPVQRFGSAFRSETQMVDDVGCVEVDSVVGVVCVDVLPVSFDSLSHCNVEISRHPVDRHVSGEVAPLPLYHFFRLRLIPSLPDALFCRILEKLRLPLSLAVCLGNLIAGITALILGFVSAVTRSAVPIGQIFSEYFQLSLLVYPVLVEFDVHFFLGIR
mmetsp:Transcript_12480/g.29586  ORF Transcript_12480/g.29586 Transcript_12480/m.29586 type:complete len:291 (+) Transcript_12480:473-1345(+)